MSKPMLTESKTFYPTPDRMADKMIAKIEGNPEEILEPSAGKGNLVDRYVSNGSRYGHRDARGISVIEIEKDLRSVLRGKDYKVIDHDFLAFAGPDKFDLIIMNPPFDNGDLHLFKAIDIMYSGQIICLLNAETLKNPYSGTRKALVRKLAELGAEIEYHQGEFEDAERKTSVEVALVNIKIKNTVEQDLFAGATDEVGEADATIEDRHEVTTGRIIEEMVADYNQIVTVATETIINYYRNHGKIWKYVGLNKEAERSSMSAKNLTGLVKSTLNATLKAIRKDFWMRCLELKEVRGRLTAKRQKEFEVSVQQRSVMDFTESNIRSFLMNLINGYDDTLTQATLEVFNRFTIKHCYDDGKITENIHYFDGWKTNNAFRVGKKVIIPVYGGSGSCPFIDWGGRWDLSYGTEREMRDIDVVMNFFDGCPHFTAIHQALKSAFKDGISRKIESTYFTITVFKKGTMHLIFKDEDILRRFNVAACLGKGWLPFDYGQKQYADMAEEEKQVVRAFEVGGEKEYSKHVGQGVFENNWSSPLMLEAA